MQEVVCASRHLHQVPAKWRDHRGSGAPASPGAVPRRIYTRGESSDGLPRRAFSRETQREKAAVKHVLAIDEGTTGVTCLVVSADGRITGRGYREITQHFPRPGWVEHDASEIFAKTIEAAREAIAASGVVPDVIGITNQRETIVVWDR